jgi:DNA repair protein RAD50
MLESEMNQQQTKFSEIESALRECESNLDFKVRQRECKILENEIEQRKVTRSQVVAMEEIEIKSKIEHLSKSCQTLSLEQAKISGAMQALQSQLESTLVLLSDDKFSNIQERFRDLSATAEAYALSLEDIDKYYKALDKGLMLYHRNKMEDINQVLRSLWQSTYRGRDIEYICIESDQLDDLQNQRKQYNYRVVMVNGEARLPMRGRCSAGQRVLACILIRMALAETFCVNCGILALDEPTTNLDAANIRALADALYHIIERRKRQSSFQLIIITHDEEFVKHLGSRDHADFYYVVAKDSENHSKIHREQLSS